GEPTEVYSRITGYYRPVQNWNDGKAQEFRDRQVYDIENSHFGGGTAKQNASECACEEKAEATLADGSYLFATPTCPNCKVACATMDKLGYAYEKLYANEHADLARAYGVRQAPTLVVVKGGQVEKYTGVSDIKRYLQV
ncbi:MAG: ribonucleoside triphosphate reductase, partial [Clostridia bacterium]|nr:ribonucleoside triphosphate reductase [Clostridia bacterium]